MTVRVRQWAALTLALAAGPAPAFAAQAPVRDAPADPHADARTRAEYRWLLDLWGTKTIAGQQDLTWNDAADMAERVHEATGK